MYIDLDLQRMVVETVSVAGSTLGNYCYPHDRLDDGDRRAGRQKVLSISSLTEGLWIRGKRR